MNTIPRTEIVSTHTTGQKYNLTKSNEQYQELLDHCKEIKDVLSILAYTILTENEYIPNIEEFLGVQPYSVYSTLSDLEPIVVCADKCVHIIEEDFVDFLLDETRAGEYYIDWGVWHDSFAHRYFERVKAGTYGTHELSLITDHLRNVKRPSEELQADILSFRFTSDQFSYLAYAGKELWNEVSDFLTVLKGLEFEDKDKAVKIQKQRMAGLIGRDPKAFHGQMRRLTENHGIFFARRRTNLQIAKNAQSFSRRKRARRVLRNSTNALAL